VGRARDLDIGSTVRPAAILACAGRGQVGMVDCEGGYLVRGTSVWDWLMAKRPALSDNSFLAYLFSPKKNALPTGLRARPITATKGRKVARVNAYNKLPAAKQEVIRRSGLRDAYLRGEVTFTDAKKSLRPKAESLGIVKPVRTRGKATGIRQMNTRSAGSIALHLLRTLRSAGKSPSVPTVVAGSNFVQEDDVMTLTYTQIKERAKDTDYMMVVDGKEFNPYWYN
jgi:hypothetical protein